MRNLWRSIFVCDFEFHQPDGSLPQPICGCYEEVGSGEVYDIWLADTPQGRASPPIEFTDDDLLVAYYSTAELSCYLQLGWQVPPNIVDLYYEFRNLTNGLPLTAGRGLLGACHYYGVECWAPSLKTAHQNLAIRGGPYSDSERSALIDYCRSDVSATCELFRRMCDTINIGPAVHRGRYGKSAAAMERHGVPINVPLLTRLRHNWSHMQAAMIHAVDPLREVYDEAGSFRIDRFSQYLSSRHIDWPRLDSGQLRLDDRAFREGSQQHPDTVGPFRELRHSLGQMRLNSLDVGPDGRNRCLLSPFASRTGRNQPSNSRFVFGPAVWIRHLISPAEGRAVAYIDWAQQEFGIGAALSRDPRMCSAYKTGDPYLAFAKQAGAVPDSGTRTTHSRERESYKVAALAVQYGMGDRSLAVRLGPDGDRLSAILLLQKHRQTFRTFWRWTQGAVDHGMMHGSLRTVFDWTLHLAGEHINERSLLNFPCQANGAEMLRLACCLTHEAGVMLLAPIHDAVLIEAGGGEIDDAVRQTQRCMEDASRAVLDGFALRSSAYVVRYPDHYADPRGEKFFDLILGLLPDPHHS